jgi:hypothetical protein
MGFSWVVLLTLAVRTLQIGTIQRLWKETQDQLGPSILEEKIRRWTASKKAS